MVRHSKGIWVAGEPEGARPASVQIMHRRKAMPSPRGEGAEHREADEVFPDVTHHVNSAFAPLDQCRGRFGRNVMAASGTAGDASPVQRTPHPSRRAAAPPSPQGEGFQSAPRPRPLPHFQSSMLLHNLSSDFSLSEKSSQRALRCTRVLHRTTATARPAASAHQAAPVSADHRHNPQRIRPQRCTRNGPARRGSGFPQSFHRLFHNFAGFPQRLSFPLAFFERDRVRYAGSVGSFCGVGYGTVLYGTVWYGAT